MAKLPKKFIGTEVGKSSSLGTPSKPTADVTKNAQPSGNFEIFTDARGQASGVTLPDGRTYLGLNRKDVKKIVEAEQAKLVTPAGVTNLTEEAKKAELQQQAQQNVSAFQKKVSEGGRIQGTENMRGLGQEVLSDVEQSKAQEKALLGFNVPVSDKMRIQLRSGGVALRETFTLRNLANTYDWIISSISRKKPLTQVQAEDTFNSLKFSLNDDIELYKTGMLDDMQIETNFQLAAEAIIRLENFQKEFTSKNLKYFTDDGASVDAQLRQMKSDLITLRTKFETAKLSQI